MKVKKKTANVVSTFNIAHHYIIQYSVMDILTNAIGKE